MVVGTLVGLGARLAIRSALESRRQERLRNTRYISRTVVRTTTIPTHQTHMQAPAFQQTQHQIPEPAFEHTQGQIPEPAFQQSQHQTPEPVLEHAHHQMQEPIPEVNNSKLQGSRLCVVVGCMSFLYIFAIPLFIVSMVLFSIANGTYDCDKFEITYEGCPWLPSCTTSYYWYNSYDTDYQKSLCDDGERQWKEWQDTKSQCAAWAIVLLVLFFVSLVIATALSILLCVRNCTKKERGLVHQEYLPAVTIHSPHIVNPVVYPVPPPSYNTVTLQNNQQPTTYMY